jgi:hypothetical protein
VLAGIGAKRRRPCVCEARVHACVHTAGVLTGIRRTSVEPDVTRIDTVSRVERFPRVDIAAAIGATCILGTGIDNR